MYPTGSTVLSSAFLRAASAPTLFPAQKLSRMAGTRSASVYGRALMMSSETGVGKYVMLRPRSPWNRAAQKLRYCSQTGTSNPNASV